MTFTIQCSIGTKTSREFLITCILLLQVFTSWASTCSNYTFSTEKSFKSCQDLPVLQAKLHWNYISSTRTIQIAYRAPQKPTGWVAWAINPTSTGMIGSQSIVAFRNSNGRMIVYPTPITSHNPSMKPGSLSYQVSNISAEYANGEIIIFAILGPFDNGSRFNHVWQAGDSVSNNIPQAHSLSGPNVKSMGTIDFQSE